MPTWDPAQYLHFDDDRTRPCRDLVMRIALEAPRCVVDLGCGPGNSTAVLAERWPAAAFLGLDSSAEMIETARRTSAERESRAAHAAGMSWAVGDITTWTRETSDTYDLVFSNAALQWVPDHATLYPQLLAHVAPGGALAVQVPDNFGAAAHRIMRELAASDSWRSRFPTRGVREWYVHDLTFYYDLLVPHATRIDAWSTEYLHILPSPDAIVEWYRGSGLRPFLDALSNEDKPRFVDAFRTEIHAAFAPQPNGSVLFPFRRFFLIVYR